VSLAHHSSISPCQKQDDACRGDAADLQNDEYGITPIHSNHGDEQAAGKPHRPSPTANACGAVFAPEMDCLRKVDRYRDRDPSEAKDLKHESRFPHVGPQDPRASTEAF
jgi:hypothetical protein